MNSQKLAEQVVNHTQNLGEIASEHRSATASLFSQSVSLLSKKMIKTFTSLKNKINLERAEMRSTLFHLEAKKSALESENASMKADSNTSPSPSRAGTTNDLLRSNSMLSMSTSTSPGASPSRYGNIYNNNASVASLDPSNLLLANSISGGATSSDIESSLDRARSEARKKQETEKVVGEILRNEQLRKALDEVEQHEKEEMRKLEKEAQEQFDQETQERIQQVRLQEQEARKKEMTFMNERHNAELQRAVELAQLAERELSHTERRRLANRHAQDAQFRILEAKHAERSRLEAAAQREALEQTKELQSALNEARAQERTAAEEHSHRRAREFEQKQQQVVLQGSQNNNVRGDERRRIAEQNLEIAREAERHLEAKWKHQLSEERARMESAATRAEKCLFEVSNLIDEIGGGTSNNDNNSQTKCESDYNNVDIIQQHEESLKRHEVLLQNEYISNALNISSGEPVFVSSTGNVTPRRHMAMNQQQQQQNVQESPHANDIININNNAIITNEYSPSPASSYSPPQHEQQQQHEHQDFQPKYLTRKLISPDSNNSHPLQTALTPRAISQNPQHHQNNTNNVDEAQEAFLSVGNSNNSSAKNSPSPVNQQQQQQQQQPSNNDNNNNDNNANVTLNAAAERFEQCVARVEDLLSTSLGQKVTAESSPLKKESSSSPPSQQQQNINNNNNVSQQQQQLFSQQTPTDADALDSTTIATTSILTTSNTSNTNKSPIPEIVRQGIFPVAPLERPLNWHLQSPLQEYITPSPSPSPRPSSSSPTTRTATTKSIEQQEEKTPTRTIIATTPTNKKQQQQQPLDQQVLLMSSSKTENADFCVRVSPEFENGKMKVDDAEEYNNSNSNSSNQNSKARESESSSSEQQQQQQQQLPFLQPPPTSPNYNFTGSAARAPIMPRVTTPTNNNNNNNVSPPSHSRGYSSQSPIRVASIGKDDDGQINKKFSLQSDDNDSNAASHTIVFEETKYQQQQKLIPKQQQEKKSFKAKAKEEEEEEEEQQEQQKKSETNKETTNSSSLSGRIVLFTAIILSILAVVGYWKVSTTITSWFHFPKLTTKSKTKSIEKQEKSMNEVVVEQNTTTTKSNETQSKSEIEIELEKEENILKQKQEQEEKEIAKIKQKQEEEEKEIAKIKQKQEEEEKEIARIKQKQEEEEKEIAKIKQKQEEEEKEIKKLKQKQEEEEKELEKIKQQKEKEERKQKEIQAELKKFKEEQDTQQQQQNSGDSSSSSFFSSYHFSWQLKSVAAILFIIVLIPIIKNFFFPPSSAAHHHHVADNESNNNKNNKIVSEQRRREQEHLQQTKQQQQQQTGNSYSPKIAMEERVAKRALEIKMQQQQQLNKSPSPHNNNNNNNSNINANTQKYNRFSVSSSPSPSPHHHQQQQCYSSNQVELVEQQDRKQIDSQEEAEHIQNLGFLEEVVAETIIKEVAVQQEEMEMIDRLVQEQQSQAEETKREMENIRHRASPSPNNNNNNNNSHSRNINDNNNNNNTEMFLPERNFQQQQNQQKQYESYQFSLDLERAEVSGREAMNLQQLADLSSLQQISAINLRIQEERKKKVLASQQLSKLNDDDFHTYLSGIKVMRLRPWRESKFDSPHLSTEHQQEFRKLELEDFRTIQQYLAAGEKEGENLSSSSNPHPQIKQDRMQLLKSFEGCGLENLPGLWQLQESKWTIESRTLLVDCESFRITKIDVSGCHLSGIFDLNSLSSCSGLLWLDVSSNNLTSVSSSSVSSFGGCFDLTRLPPKLKFLYGYRNNFSGNLDLTNLPSTLEVLQLQYNYFEGIVNFANIPASLLDLNLSNQLSENKLNGHAFEIGFHPNSKLKFLDVSGNNLEGEISVQNLPQQTLERLFINDNKLTLLNFESLPCNLTDLFAQNNDLKSVVLSPHTNSHLSSSSVSSASAAAASSSSTIPTGSKRPPPSSFIGLQSSKLPRTLKRIDISHNKRLNGTLDLQTLPESMTHFDASYCSFNRLIEFDCSRHLPPKMVSFSISNCDNNNNNNNNNNLSGFVGCSAKTNLSEIFPSSSLKSFNVVEGNSNLEVDPFLIQESRNNNSSVFVVGSPTSKSPKSINRGKSPF